MSLAAAKSAKPSQRVKLYAPLDGAPLAFVLRLEAIGVEGRRASVRRIPKMNVREGHANLEITGSSAQSHGGLLVVVGGGCALVWW